jgi:hypothetical protein
MADLVARCGDRPLGTQTYLWSPSPPGTQRHLWRRRGATEADRGGHAGPLPLRRGPAYARGHAHGAAIASLAPASVMLGSQSWEPTPSDLPRFTVISSGGFCWWEALRSTPSDRGRHRIRAWGSRGRRFKSGRPDQKVQVRRGSGFSLGPLFDLREPGGVT